MHLIVLVRTVLERRWQMVAHLRIIVTLLIQKLRVKILEGRVFHGDLVHIFHFQLVALYWNLILQRIRVLNVLRAEVF